MGGGVGDDVGVAFGPSGDVADAVVAGVDAEHSGGDVGDGFGFDLAAAAVGDVVGGFDVGVHEGVGGLVQHGLGGLGVGEVGGDDDTAGSVGGGVPVRAGLGDLFAADGPALGGDVVDGAAVEVGGVVTDEGVGGAGEVDPDPGLGVLGAHPVGDLGDGVGLGDVEHGQDRVGGDLAFGFVAGLGVGVGDRAGTESADPDRFFSLADVASEFEPFVVSGDLGGVGALGEDQQQVVEAVGVKLGGVVEECSPLVGAGERGDFVGDGCV